MIALSTIPMILIEIVSEASASGITALSAIPERSSGQARQQCSRTTNASTIESAIVARSDQPSAVPMIMPSTSPIAQPVRQWTVALNASAFSDFGS